MEAKSIKQGIKISNLMLYLIKTRHLSKSLIKPPKICAIMFLRVITELFLLMELLELEKLILWLVTSKNQGWCFIRSINSSFKLNKLKIWENKKARIDEDVTYATYLNLIEAYIFVDDFSRKKKQIFFWLIRIRTKKVVFLFKRYICLLLLLFKG